MSGMISRNICPYHWVTLFLLPSFSSINCQNFFSDIQKNSGETGNYCSADRLHHIWHASIWGISIPWSHIQPMHYLFLTSTARIPSMTFKTILQKWQIIFQLKDFTTSDTIWTRVCHFHRISFCNWVIFGYNIIQRLPTYLFLWDRRLFFSWQTSSHLACFELRYIHTMESHSAYTSSFSTINCQDFLYDIQNNIAEVANYFSAEGLHHIWHLLNQNMSFPQNLILQLVYLWLQFNTKTPIYSLTFQLCLGKPATPRFPDVLVLQLNI